MGHSGCSLWHSPWISQKWKILEAIYFDTNKQNPFKNLIAEVKVLIRHSHHQLNWTFTELTALWRAWLQRWWIKTYGASLQCFSLSPARFGGRSNVNAAASMQHVAVQRSQCNGDMHEVSFDTQRRKKCLSWWLSQVRSIWEARAKLMLIGHWRALATSIPVDHVVGAHNLYGPCGSPLSWQAKTFLRFGQIFRALRMTGALGWAEKPKKTCIQKYVFFHNNLRIKTFV